MKYRLIDAEKTRYGVSLLVRVRVWAACGSRT